MNLEQLVEWDLGEYDQEYLYPQSLTVTDDENWRHYELGEIVGFVVFNDGGWIGLAELNEDDDFWYVPNHPMYMSAGWTKGVYETFSRMNAWIKEHIFIGRDEDGEWVEKLIKPIQSEEIRRDPDN